MINSIPNELKVPFIIILKNVFIDGLIKAKEYDMVFDNEEK